MPPSTHEALHSINDHLRVVLKQWAKAPGEPGALLPEALNMLLARLSQAAELLKNRSAGNRDAQVEKEVCDYRANVERLQELLPHIHNRLLAEKARLESVRAHLEAAAAWADARKKVL